MIVKLLLNNILSVLALKQAVHARLSLHLSKCHIVGNRMLRLIYGLVFEILILIAHSQNRRRLRLRQDF